LSARYVVGRALLANPKDVMGGAYLLKMLWAELYLPTPRMLWEELVCEGFVGGAILAKGVVGGACLYFGKGVVGGACLHSVVGGA